MSNRISPISGLRTSVKAASASSCAPMPFRMTSGGRLPEPVASSALLPRQVDYARTSDEQILEM